MRRHFGNIHNVESQPTSSPPMLKRDGGVNYPVQYSYALSILCEDVQVSAATHSKSESPMSLIPLFSMASKMSSWYLPNASHR